MKQLSYQTRILVICGLLLFAPLFSFAQACCHISKFCFDWGTVYASSCDNPESNTVWYELNDGEQLYYDLR